MGINLKKDCMPSLSTDVRRMTRGLATLPEVSQEPLKVKDKGGRSQEDLLVVYCFCICGDVIRC